MKTIILAVSLAALSLTAAKAADPTNTIGDGPWATMTSEQILQRNVHDAGYLNTSASIGDASAWTVMTNGALVQANLSACCHGKVPDYTLTAN